MDRSSSAPGPPPSDSQPLWTLLLRMSWLAIGPAALLLFVVNKLMHPLAGLTARDAAFAAVAAVTIVLRWIDFQYGEPRFPGMERSTPSQVRNYSLLVGLAAAVSWLVAHALGSYFVR